MVNVPILTITYALPLVGAAAILLIPRERAALARPLALFFTSLALIASLLACGRFDAALAGYQLVESTTWIPRLGITYHLGIDGISLPLVLLTTFLGPITVLSAFGCITERHKEFYAALLALIGFSLGSFLALDTVLFYLFFELMLVPMFLIIGIWGGKGRVHAAVKFFLFTVAGSLPFLLGLIALKIYSGSPTFGLTDLLSMPALAPSIQCWLFLAFAFAFAIKVPMVPVHTWLPDAHGEAPTPGSVWLAAVLLKVGVYGFLRFALPLFPVAVETFAPYLMALSVIGIVYGALLALAQTNMKRLVAYSSVSHMGYIMLGVFALNEAGIAGGVFQMVAHGLTTGGLFLLVGMLYERRHTLDIPSYGGLARVMPWHATAFMVVVLGSAALPGLCGFIGEFLVLLGAARVGWLWAALGGLGIIFGAAYLLVLYRGLMFGAVRHRQNESLPDLSLREGLVIAPVAVLIVVLGLLPSPVLQRVRPAVGEVLRRVEAGGAVAGRAAARPAAPPAFLDRATPPKED
ncbi:MAG: NADH-quinone oxidoreductase subunit M [Planctomycetes bacterium]|nr:NADH-quinone oxidoreductase subunit M [Planctomycetota bacterium]